MSGVPPSVHEVWKRPCHRRPAVQHALVVAVQTGWDLSVLCLALLNCGGQPEQEAKAGPRVVAGCLVVVFFVSESPPSTSRAGTRRRG